MQIGIGIGPGFVPGKGWKGGSPAPSIYDLYKSSVESDSGVVVNEAATQAIINEQIDAGLREDLAFYIDSRAGNRFNSANGLVNKVYSLDPNPPNNAVQTTASVQLPINASGFYDFNRLARLELETAITLQTGVTINVWLPDIQQGLATGNFNPILNDPSNGDFTAGLSLRNDFQIYYRGAEFRPGNFLNQTKMLTIVDNGSNARLYFNGVPVNLLSTGLPIINATHIGLGSAGRFLGEMGELRIYNKALSALEIDTMFQNTRARYGV